jgi:hypothetical protein
MTTILAIQIFGLNFDDKIDIGHFLTFVTLVAGFVWWLYTTIRAWRKTSNDEARSGALRLLIRMLRERKGSPASFKSLFEEFHSPTRKAQREAYCRRDFKFKSEDTFEAAIYRLDWEGKIDFVSSDEIVFRVDRYRSQGSYLTPTGSDRSKVVDILKSGFTDTNFNVWDLEKIAQTAMRIAPEQASTAIHEMLENPDVAVQRRAAAILGGVAAPAKP